MRKEFRADKSAESKVNRDRKADRGSSCNHQAMINRPSHRTPIALFQKLHDRVVPFAHSFTKQQAG